MRNELAAVIGTTLLSTASVATAADSSSQWFYANVTPRLVENGCPNCHTVGHLNPRVLHYEELLPYLAMGWTRDNNVLLYKMANLRSISPDKPTHPGGQRCNTPDAEPCATFKRWWDVEFGARRPK